MVFIAAIIILVLILVFGPQVWVRHVMKRYSNHIEQLPGTGGELARHLVARLGLEGVTVEPSDQDENHYDPVNRQISLSPDVHDGKSLTAVSISAHEVGHAIQHLGRYKPLIIRWQLARFVQRSEQLASIALMAFPLVVLVTRLPAAGAMMLVLGIGLMLVPVLFHLITLPVELDASFQRALPILVKGQYIPESAVPVVNRILFAAALTYVSASLASLLNFYRWVAILRR